LSAARHGLALTGAGISAESGIPTYRGADGLWTVYDPFKTASIEFFMNDPGAYWKVALERGGPALVAKPNPGHQALTALESGGHLVAVVTQNTDGLHQDAGTKRVLELHGNGRMTRCLDCGAQEPRAEVQARLALEMPPRCRACGGSFLKPSVVFFGEAMPQAAVKEATELARRSDVMLVVGSSLVVFPAAEIPVIALDSGARLVIVNAEPTPLDELAEVVLRGRAGEVLPQVLALIGG